ncbi:hypothetical protein DFS34DRAFT_685902 [Phlyctochytrium arcticum]|nr:hypothetical protein DFS34DRAFT_685902 [Phlyctochytrium arcticum]
MAMTTPAKRLFIVRGPPGSGKSTLCREVAEHYSFGSLPTDPDQLEEFYKKHILCTSDLFISSVDQVYRYDFNKLAQKHDENKDRCLAAMKAGISPIVIGNTALQKWEAKPMTEEVELLSVRNRHNIGVDIIKSMLDRWEGDEWTVDAVLASSREEEIQKLRARWEGKMDAVHQIRRSLRSTKELPQRKIRDVTTITNAYRAPREEEYNQTIDRLVSKTKRLSLAKDKKDAIRGSQQTVTRRAK